MNSSTIEEDKVYTLTMVDYIKIFIRYKKIILTVSFVCALIVAFLMFFVFPPIFKSTAVVKISSKSSGLNSLLSSGGSLPGIGDVGELTGSSSSSKEMALYDIILNSRRSLEETILKFKLNEEWEVKYMQDAVKHFRESVIEINKDKIAGTMEISIYDKDPNKAKEICDYLIFELNKINIEMNIQYAKNNKEFIETRYNIIKNDLRSAEDSLKNYQDIYGVAPDLQIKAATQADISLETELKSEELKLEILSKILSPDQAELSIQQSKIEALKKQISELKSNSDDNYMLRLKGSAGILTNYLRLYRNVELQTKLLTFILPIFEQSKIDEKRDTPSVIVLDQANVPEVKSKPKRLTTIFISFVSSFFLIYISILIYILFIKKLLINIKKVS